MAGSFKVRARFLLWFYLRRRRRSRLLLALAATVMASAKPAA